MQKKTSILRQRLEAIPELGEAEKALWLRCLLATPDERWRMNQASLKSLGFGLRSQRKKSVFS